MIAMTQEEKAKAYDEAYKVAESIHRFSSNPAEIKRMEEIFPQLRESKDERIRKGLVAHLKDLREWEVGKCVPIKTSGHYDAWLAWLEKQKERSHLSKDEEQKPWSEEDENHVKSILSTIECCKAQFPNAQAVVEAYNADIEWLKSLKPQNRWKPSDAQIASITCAVRKMKESACYDSELVSLLNDLKKLREE